MTVESSDNAISNEILVIMTPNTPASNVPAVAK